MLAQFLLENGIRTYYVCGEYRDGSFENFRSHAWLLANNQIIIDITGDQFRMCQPRLIELYNKLDSKKFYNFKKRANPS